MDVLRLIEIALASRFVAYAVTNTSGPFGVFEWIRQHLPLGGLTSCIICLMPWTALILWLAPDGIVIWTLAAAGLALMLHSFTGWKFSGG